MTEHRHRFKKNRPIPKSLMPPKNSPIVMQISFYVNILLKRYSIPIETQKLNIVTPHTLFP